MNASPHVRKPLHRAMSKLSTAARAVMPLAGFFRARATQSKHPLAVTLCLTNRCNFRCVYCHMPQTHRDELTTSQWLDAIDRFKAGGMLRCSLMGGEPLVRRDVGEIIDHLVRHQVHSAMNTNGWLVEDRIEEVSRLNLVCIGLDGPESIHDLQRQRKGSFKRALRAIALLVDRDVEVVTMTPVTPRNIDTIDEVLAMAREMGFRAGFQIEHDAECDVRNPIGAGMSDERLLGLAKHLLARKAEGAPVAVSSSFLRRFASSGRRMLDSCSNCRVPQFSCMVRPDGMVVPCFLTQHQGPMVSGSQTGFLHAFRAVGQPDGPGCSSQPLMEMNMLFGLHPGAVANALRLV